MNSKALQKIHYGMFVVSSRKGGEVNGQIANTIFQITANPATIAVSINKSNLTHEFIRESRVFTVSVLSEETPMTHIGRFGFKSGRDIRKFDGIESKTGVTGAPIALPFAVAYLEAEAIAELDIGTHTIFIGKVVDAEVLSDTPAMTYDHYHKIKGGLTPKTAPTYEAPAQKMEGTGMKKYQCNVCGYVYDPEKGDPDNGIKPGTAFEQLPETWTCPVCGAPKSEFSPV